MNEISPLSMREKVTAIENEILKLPQAEMKLVHYFSDGVYARELHIPAGAILTGKIHKYTQLNILTKGCIRVLLEEGIKELNAPFTVVSPPGTKRIAFAVTDCIWTTILATNETDPNVIEDQFTASSEQEYQAFLEQEKQLCLSSPAQQ